LLFGAHHLIKGNAMDRLVTFFRWIAAASIGVLALLVPQTARAHSCPFDNGGSSLAAIQGLHQIVKAKDAKISALEKANVTMLREMAAVKKKLGL
jgi:hypothetical protein